MARDSQTGADDSSDEQIELSADVGGRIKANVQRGTGTDDRDSWTIEAEGQDAAETIAEFRKEVDAFEQEFFERVRNIQIEEADDE